MYIIRNKTTKEIIRRSATPITIDGSTPIGLDPALEIIEEITVQPTFDSSLEKIVQVEETVNGKTTLIFNTVLLTKEEVASRADFIAQAQARTDAQTRALDAIKANKGTDWGAVLYDQAISRGEIVEENPVVATVNPVDITP